MLRVPDAFRATRSSGVDARYTSKQARPRGSAPGFPDDVFGENTKNRGDHSMAWGSGLNQPDQTPSSSGISIRRIRRWPCLQHQDYRPSALGFGSFLTALTPRHHLASTTSVDNGPRIQATERAHRRFLDVERGHPRSKSGEEQIEGHSRQGSFRRGQRPSPHNQSKSPLTPCS